MFHILKDRVSFNELGIDFLDKLEPERKAKYHERRLEKLGYHLFSGEIQAKLTGFPGRSSSAWLELLAQFGNVVPSCGIIKFLKYAKFYQQSNFIRNPF